MVVFCSVHVSRTLPSFSKTAHSAFMICNDFVSKTILGADIVRVFCHKILRAYLGNTLKSIQQVEPNLSIFYLFSFHTFCNTPAAPHKSKRRKVYLVVFVAPALPALCLLAS